MNDPLRIWMNDRAITEVHAFGQSLVDEGCKTMAQTAIPIQEQEITLVVYVDSFCKFNRPRLHREALRNMNQVRFKNLKAHAVGFEKGIVLEANLPFIEDPRFVENIRSPKAPFVFGVKAVPFEQKMLKRVRLGDLLCAGGI